MPRLVWICDGHVPWTGRGMATHRAGVLAHVDEAIHHVLGPQQFDHLVRDEALGDSVERHRHAAWERDPVASNL